jgi:hypothetical protein
LASLTAGARQAEHVVGVAGRAFEGLIGRRAAAGARDDLLLLAEDLVEFLERALEFVAALAPGPTGTSRTAGLSARTLRPIAAVALSAFALCALALAAPAAGALRPSSGLLFTALLAWETVALLCAGTVTLLAGETVARGTRVARAALAARTALPTR